MLAWATTEQVSIQGEQMLDDGGKLKILVEKDFVCLTGRDDEDESDMYPHPEADSGTVTWQRVTLVSSPGPCFPGGAESQ